MYEQQLQRVAQLEQTVESQQITISSLQLQLIQLQKFIFSGKQEKFKADANATPLQANLFADEKLAEVVVERKTIVPEHTKVKISVRINHKGRNPLPAHLRREVVVLEPSEDVAGLKLIGQQVTETLEWQSAQIFIRQTVRNEYLRPSADNTSAERVIAPLPDNGFAKCMAGISLLVHIAISKYIDHLPIYRLQKIFNRDKIKIDDATLYNWLKRLCSLLEPLYQLHRKMVLSTRYLSADETTIAVLDEQKKGAAHQGYFWAYYDTVQRLVLFEYQKGRAAKYPKEVLQNYQGYLLSDGYEGYGQFDDRADIITHNCWAHARRKFYDAQNFDKDKCQAVLTLIAKLYEVEQEHKTSDAATRQAARQKDAVPVIDQLFALLTQYHTTAIPGTPLYTAIKYSLQRWDKLKVYVTDGNLQIDNNLLENSIRPIAIGRKNYLFAGSHEAAQRSAMFYSLFHTCNEHGINPKEWLQYTLEHIYGTRPSELHKLLPQNYAATFKQK